MIKTYFDTFTGIGGGTLAIKKVFPDAKCVGYSEINKHTNKVYQNHFPGHKNFGDITKLKNLPNFDFLIGGSNCQDFSIQTKNRKGLNGEKSKLFFNYLEILKTNKPKYFLLENVASMSRENKNIISLLLDVEPICIDSARLTAQHRERLYFCNWPVSQPEDKNILMPGMVAWSKSGRKPNKHNEIRPNWKCNKNGKWYEERFRQDGKANTLVTGYGCAGPSTQNFINNESLDIITCERLQGFPSNWTLGISDRQRYKAIGNAFTVPVIEYILIELKNHIKKGINK